MLGLILDSTAASARHHERELQRTLFWSGDDPRTREAARLVRIAARRGTAGEVELVGVVPAVFEFVGPGVLEVLLRRVAAGRRPWLWRRLAAAVAAEGAAGKPLIFEPDPAMAIWYAEIDRTPPDGRPFDRALLMEPERERYAELPFRPFDLAARLSELKAPVVVLADDRDARAFPSPPRPRCSSTCPMAGSCASRTPVTTCCGCARPRSCASWRRSRAGEPLKPSASASTCATRARAPSGRSLGRRGSCRDRPPPSDRRYPPSASPCA